MNVDELFSRIVRAARQQTPSSRVPYAFEKRIMARLPALRQVDIVALWSTNLWRAAIASVCLTLSVGIWSYHRSARTSASEDISLAFEKTVFASMDQHVEDAW